MGTFIENPMKVRLLSGKEVFVDLRAMADTMRYQTLAREEREVSHIPLGDFFLDHLAVVLASIAQEDSHASFHV